MWTKSNLDEIQDLVSCGYAVVSVKDLDNTYFDGYYEYYDCTITVFTSDGMVEAEYEDERITPDALVVWHNGED